MAKPSEQAKLRSLLSMVQARTESCEGVIPTLKNAGEFERADWVQHRLEVYREVAAMIERKIG